MRKGVLEFCILSVLSTGDKYPSEIIERMKEAKLIVVEGTLYPLLSRLRVQGLITARLEESSTGPARKYYSLTKEGRKAMAAMNDYLELLNEGARTLRAGGK